MMQSSSHSDAHITLRSARTPDAHTPDASPAKSDRSRIMIDRRSKKEQRETSRSGDDVVITEHRVGKRTDACPNKEPEDPKCVRKDMKKLKSEAALAEKLKLAAKGLLQRVKKTGAKGCQKWWR